MAFFSLGDGLTALASSRSIAESISGVSGGASLLAGSATETQATAAELARMATELRTTVAAYQV